MADVHADLISNLEAALDVRKMMSVFTSLIGILKEQQGKIDDLASKMHAPVDLKSRLEEIEAKIADIELFTKGGGFGDDAVLHENTLEVSPFVAFHRASMMLPPASVDEEEELLSPSKDEVMEKIKSSRPSFRTSFAPDSEEKSDGLPSARSGKSESRKPSRRASPLTRESSKKQLQDPSPRLTPEKNIHDEIDKVEQLIEEVKEEERPRTRPVTPKIDAPLPEENEDELDDVNEGKNFEQEIESEFDQIEEKLVEEEIPKVQKVVKVEPIIESEPDPEPELEPEPQLAPLSEPEPELEPDSYQDEIVIREEQIAKQKEPTPRPITPKEEEAIFEPQLNHSADEMEIGDVSELPQIQSSSVEDKPPSRKSRQRAIPDYRPPADSKSLTRKSIHPNDIPKEIHSMYGPSADPTRSRKVTPKSTPRGEMKQYHLTRRRMSLRNLPFLSSQRCKKILRELKMRGRFLRISREMFEEQRKKYSTQSLKQKLDYLEAEMIKLTSKLDKVKDNNKKHNISIKEGFSFIKQQNDNFQSQLSALEEDLQELVYKKRNQPAPQAKSNGLGDLADDANVMQLLKNAGDLNEVISIISTKGGNSLLEKLLHTNSRSNILTRENFEEEMMSSLTNQIKMGILGPELHQIHSTMTQYHHKLQSVMADAVNKNELSNMLKASTDSSNTDSNHMKLMNLINKSIISSQERLEQLFDEKLKKVLTSSMLLNAINAAEGANKGAGGLSSGTQQALDEFKEDVNRVQHDASKKIHHLEEDILYIKDQIHYFDLFRVENMTELQRLDKARQQEAEQLKIMQKRIANLSVDKLLDDLKSVHKQLLEKPTTEQVGTMMEAVENTFKEHLGENVNGLKSLVHQVYRHIQHKVDREDIKNLIASRLAQMEKEIIVREEELYNLASSTRCLSCGQLPRESWQAANSVGSANSKKPQQVIHFPPGVPNKRDLSPDGVRGSSTSPIQHEDSLSHLSHHIGSPMNDEIEVQGSGGESTFLTSDVTGANPYSQSSSEHIYALLTGQAGLKPIQLQHSPLLPQSRPHTTANTGTKRKTEKIPDPAHRKAKLSAHMKEMVKVSAPAVEQYGYTPVNPLYVLEGSVVDQDETIGSRQLIGSHSLNSLASQQRGIKSMVGEYTMVNDPRASRAASRKTGAPEILVLPDIHNSSNGVSSKPNSPGSVMSRDTMASSRRGRSGSTTADREHRGSVTSLGEPQIVISQMKLASHL